jgi:hypothetical protein
MMTSNYTVMLERDANFSCNEGSLHVCVYICRLSEHKGQTQPKQTNCWGSFIFLREI